jgi:hypothetical protein
LFVVAVAAEHPMWVVAAEKMMQRRFAVWG